MFSVSSEQDWKFLASVVVSSRNNLPKAIMIVRQQSILASKTFLQLRNSQVKRCPRNGKERVTENT